jgi:hypothetical protein
MYVLFRIWGVQGGDYKEYVVVRREPDVSEEHLQARRVSQAQTSRSRWQAKLYLRVLTFIFIVWGKYEIIDKPCFQHKQEIHRVRIASRYSYGLDGQGSIPGRDKKFFSIPQRSYRLWGPSSLLPNWYQGIFPRALKRPWREADHSAPSSAEGKNGGGMPPFP